MMIKFKKINIYFVLSLIAHLSILVSFSLAFTDHFGSRKNKNVYLPTYFLLPTNLAPHEKSAKEAAPHSKLATIHHQYIEPILAKNNQLASNNFRNKYIKGSSNQELLKILHDSIAAKQSYPESALELNQKGKVVVGFYLAPDGNLSRISMLKSSGYDSIDSAALLAVKSVDTITNAGLYLNKKEFFSIEVIFL